LTSTLEMSQQCILIELGPHCANDTVPLQYTVPCVIPTASQQSSIIPHVHIYGWFTLLFYISISVINLLQVVSVYDSDDFLLF